MEAPAAQDEHGARSGVGGDEAIAEPQRAAQGEAFGLLGQDGIGPALHDEAAHRLRADHPAEARRGLEEQDVAAGLVQGEGAGEAGDAPSHDDDLRTIPHEADRTRAARARMNAGDVLRDAVRPSTRPRRRAAPAACTSTSKRISVWSHTKPMGATSARRAPSRAARASASSSEGPNQGSGVRPALW